MAWFIKMVGKGEMLMSLYSIGKAKGIVVEKERLWF